MKKLILILMISFIGNWLMGQTTKTIGTTNDGSRELPFGMYYGFERSATIYTKSEISTFCFITSLGWKVQAGNQESCPTKIYLKLTILSTLSATTWNDMKTGATLVYDATTSFPTAGWQTINIADFTYWSSVSGTNLLVLCETNYGEIPPSNYPWFWYSLTGTNKHEFWQNNDSTQFGNGVPDKLRPDIQITYLPISAHNPPSGFMATAVSPSQIDLAWTKNNLNDNIMVAYNTTNTFGTPSGAYVPGSAITGGGTVIYNGSGTSWSQDTALSPATTYYYMAWSVIASPLSYSAGTSASATTLCEVTGAFPLITDFEPVLFPPSCWSLASKPWTRSAAASGYGIGAASAKADFFSIDVGNFDLFSPGLDLSSMTAPYVKFDHAYATYDVQVDKLELWYSTDHDTTYTVLHSWLGGAGGPLNTGGAQTIAFIPTAAQWATKSYGLPAATTNIMLRGVTAHGNNLYLDNLTIYDDQEFVTWNGSVSSAWNNRFNWTPNTAIPNKFQIVTIPQGTAHSPTVNTTGLTCKQLTIDSGATLTVSISSDITVNGNMTMQNGATLNNLGLLTVKGNFDIQN